MFYFYILRCKDNSLYCGIAEDIKNREKMHNSGKGSVYVKTHGGGKIIYHEGFQSKNGALKREAEVKKWPRKKKQNLTRRSPA